MPTSCGPVTPPPLVVLREIETHVEGDDGMLVTSVNTTLPVQPEELGPSDTTQERGCAPAPVTQVANEEIISAKIAIGMKRFITVLLLTSCEYC